MKKQLLFIIMSTLVAIGLNAQSTALLVDFETLGSGYTPSATIGSGWVDLFNRTDFNMTTVNNEDGFYWGIEDKAGSYSLTLDQINVSNASSFTLGLDWVTHHSNDWDGGTYMRIYYIENSGSDQNLLWVENVPNAGNTTNEPAAVDLNFDGNGECLNSLPARSTSSNGCNIGEGRNHFETYSTSSISLSTGATTLDIRIDFNNFNQNDIGMYIDNITIDTVGSSASVSPIITVSPSSLSGLDYVENAGPSSASSILLDGSDLTANITGSGASSFEFSPDNSTWGAFPSTDVSSASQQVYVRLVGGLGVGTYNETLTLSSTGASDVTVSLSGEVTVAPCVQSLQTLPYSGISGTAGFDHSTSNPPAAAPAESCGTNFILTYASTPVTDGGSNEFGNQSNLGLSGLSSADFGGPASFQTFPVDVSAVTAVDITAVGNTAGSGVFNGSAGSPSVPEQFEWWYSLDGGAQQVFFSSTSDGSLAASQLNLDVTGVNEIVLGFNFAVNGAGDGFEGMDVSIIEHVPSSCSIDAISAATPSACDAASSTYAVDVTVTYTNPPATGDIDVNGQTFAVISSPQTLTLTNLTADGASTDVTAFFADDPSCTLTESGLYTAPAACTPDIIINEFQADPDAIDGDANGDGVVSTTHDEFVELYNNESSDVDMSGWTISDNNGVVHTFPAGTNVAAGSFVTVFGGGTPTGISGIAMAAIPSGLNLNNDGDGIFIKTASGTLVVSHTYGSSAGNNQALGREPDLTGSFVQHSTICGVLGRRYTPGALNVNATPLCSITSSADDMCEGDTRTLTSSGSGTVFSGTGVSGNIFTAPDPGSASADYTITATNGCCSETQIITVYENLSFTSTAEDICEGTQRTLSATPSGGTFSGAGVSGSIFTAPTPASGNSETFTVSYSIPGSPCTSTQSIIVFTDPTAASAGADVQSCISGSVTMAASQPSVGTGEWTWSSQPSYTSGNPISPAASVSFSSAGTYTGTWTVSNGACGDVANPQTAEVIVTSAANNMTLDNNGMTSTAVEVCTEGAWTYYATSAKPNEYLFAINKNGNTFTADVTITDVAGSAPIESVDNARGTWLLSRYWNASIISGSIATTVAIRYFIDDAELTAAINAADAFLAASPLSGVSAVTPLTFFKTQSAAFNPNTDLINGDFTFTPTYLNIKTTGTTNGYTYYELDGITSFSGGTGGFGVNDGGTSLPVELISFNAKAVDNQYIQLDWATATEINNDGFEVLRGTDGINFERIAWMDGHGNSTATNKYVFRDHGVNKGVNYYYQLKQIDYDGQYEYFDIETARLEGTINFFIGAIVPNPSKGNDAVSVNVETTTGEVMTIQIFDQIGAEVKKLTYMLFAADNGLDIDVSDLVEGTYFLTFETRMGTETRKLVVIK